MSEPQEPQIIDKLWTRKFTLTPFSYYFYYVLFKGLALVLLALLRLLLFLISYRNIGSLREWVILGFLSGKGYYQ